MSPRARGPSAQAVSPLMLAGLIAALSAATGSARHKPEAPIASGAVVAALIWMILGPVWLVELGLLIDALRSGDLADVALALVVLATTTIVLFPWPIARSLLIPRGQVRLAWAVTRLSFWVWRRDVRGGALIAASWAATRRAQRGVELSSELITWIDRRMAAAPRGAVRWKLGGAGIIAAGLLAEARQDRTQTRRLLSSAAELAEPTRPRRAIALASEWLCAEAIERGAWREVEFLARTAPLETRTTKFLGSVAARLSRVAPVPSDLVLRWQWFAAPHRLATRELLLRALATPATAREASGEARRVRDPVVAEGPPLLVALSLHAQALGLAPSDLRRDEISRLARAWDAALADPSLDQRLAERGAALGAHASLQRPDQLSELVREDLLGLVRGAGLELGQLSEDSELLGRAARQLRGELLDGLEIATGALESRVDSKRELPALDEWAAFLALREQYAEAASLGGLGLRRLAFGTVHGPVCSLAVWLWNDRSERALANAMFRWLLAEAVVVDDAAAVRLQERNVDCGV
ncbi:hypothetical protein ENSA5_68800 [Enhygromyxa salina]|uniref:Uncharacterized protein n=1 Tax=Enhygromyxa salina TaxID=215803 RepID=A0A2S9XB48_9BACT|nr:hypothetical protein [Enhygromyxa salina]PRP90020.1 hypothetical protein ENSA5_68800 [Enhygromyxa salina]